MMAVGDDFGDEPENSFRCRRGRPNTKRARITAVGGRGMSSQRAGFQKKKATAGLAAAAAESVAAFAYVVAEDADALDCGVCFQPLKPPAFQCNVGHVVCSLCCDKLKASGKCHVCGVSIGGYSRCHAMERLVNCIGVHCPNAVHGCTTKPAYYDQHSHCQTCPHVPCHYPGEGCSFIGSTSALLDHIAGVHGWPCIAGIRTGNKCTIHLCEGFNILIVNHDVDGNQQGVTATPAASKQWLFLVNVAQKPLDFVISVLCINPHATMDPKEIECNFCYSQCWINNCYGDAPFISHYQDSTFIVACTDLSNGLPNLDEWFRFVVPNSIVEDKEEHAIEVEARIIIK
ncbi:hypothetical protein PR202_gb24854 [Eleusine coracana subsp. coracana]|uniref:RING-type E3 ubiquitin transferase n=1 Tax=Eleusine coracana subsp. coracana TaxID=191504 RepID=A0AAV5FK49_ELECO|nr:hypothetical protein PR202_gb24854 [Eleusine coracana subsp. coracana]